MLIELKAFNTKDLRNFLKEAGKDGDGSAGVDPLL